MAYKPNTTLFRLSSFAAIAMVALAASSAVQATQPGHEVIGEWKFTAVLDGVDITSIDEKQAKRLLGQIMTIKKEGIRFGDEKCGAPSFDSKRVEPRAYVLQEARIQTTKLGLPNPVTVVDLGCTQVFVKKANLAVIFWDGFFFNARKVNRVTSDSH